MTRHLRRSIVPALAAVGLAALTFSIPSSEAVDASAASAASSVETTTQIPPCLQQVLTPRKSANDRVIVTRASVHCRGADPGPKVTVTFLLQEKVVRTDGAHWVTRRNATASAVNSVRLRIWMPCQPGKYRAFGDFDFFSVEADEWQSFGRPLATAELFRRCG